MRQIKFRGKSIYTSKWMYGCVAIRGERAYISAIDCGVHSEVFLSTVGQFTGLTDCNGKEIYEGDIIEEHNLLYEVAWYADIAAFMAEDIQSEKLFLMSDMDLSKTRVIGNVHDNSELLTEKLNKQ